jgi:hypothetical protein
VTHRPYPNLDIECVTTLIDIGRRGAIRTEIKSFAKCGYELLGAGLLITVGEPDDVIPIDGVTSVGFGDAPEPTIEQVEEAHGYLTAALPDLESYGAEEGGAEAIDPATLTMIVTLILKGLELWLSRKKGG